MKRAVYLTGSSLILKQYNDKDIVIFYDTKEEAREALLKTKNTLNTYDVHFDYGRGHVFLGCYIYHFMKHVEGEVLYLSDFDIFNEAIKREYVTLLNKYVNLPLESKLWYHILIACYMYKNGSYDLTEAQLSAVQRTHDKGITESKYKFCIDTLKELS